MDSQTTVLDMPAGRPPRWVAEPEIPRHPENAHVSEMERIASGDRPSFERLFDRTERLVYSLALRMLRRPDEAEEVTLDVFAQVWRSARAYDPRRASVEAWLVMLTRSRALDRLRARAARPDLDRPAILSDMGRQLPDQERACLRSEVGDRIREALGGLCASERAVIELAYFDGYTHSELAKKLNLPLGTVKTRIRMGLHKMRRTLTETGFERLRA